MTCVCNQSRKANGVRAGTPVALWACPEHGHVFEEVPLGITLTPFQEEVLVTIKREHDAGRSPSVDDLSRLLNRTTASIGRAMSVLQAVGFIERDGT